MTENIAHKVDRTGWPAGEWDNEPDRFDFIHAGFSCFILRNSFGNWCGYVGVPKGHQAYGLGYDSLDLNVHGGITYADKCSAPICHIPEPGMPEDVWWLGFDTAHYMDMSPNGRMGREGIYRNMAYVIEETKQLADQLKG